MLDYELENPSSAMGLRPRRQFWITTEAGYAPSAFGIGLVVERLRGTLVSSCAPYRDVGDGLVKPRLAGRELGTNMEPL